jgi:putative membrane protein insertion efficiency factor
VITRALIALVRFYQRALSPLKGPTCRFHPTCSHYAIEALQTHGVLRGLWYALRRLLRCQPFARGGFDPVPPPRVRRQCED